MNEQTNELDGESVNIKDLRNKLIPYRRANLDQKLQISKDSQG